MKSIKDLLRPCEDSNRQLNDFFMREFFNISNVNIESFGTGMRVCLKLSFETPNYKIEIPKISLSEMLFAEYDNSGLRDACRKYLDTRGLYDGYDESNIPIDYMKEMYITLPVKGVDGYFMSIESKNSNSESVATSDK